MNLSTTITHESAALEGVKFTVRRLNYIDRCQRDMAMLDDRAAAADLTRRIALVSDEGEDGKRTAHPGKEQEFSRLNAEHSMLYQSRIVPAYIRAGLVSVEGVEVDGKPADVGTFTKWASDALLDEVFAACYQASDLTDEQRKNLQSPGSLDAAEAGQASNTTADVAPA